MGSERRQRTALVALRLLPAERARIEIEARARNESLSEFIRQAALIRAAQRDAPSDGER